MKNNTNTYNPDFEYCNCCNKEICEKEKDTCMSEHKKRWEEYICNEKPDEGEPWELCDYDPNEIYFMQYRSKRAFYNEPWKDKLSIKNIHVKKKKEDG